MKAVFFTSLLCALTSLLALVALSAITIIPRPKTENFRGQAMLVVGIFLVVWLCLAFWARVRQRPDSHPLPPQWLRQLLVITGIAYLVCVFLLVAG